MHRLFHERGIACIEFISGFFFSCGSNLHYEKIMCFFSSTIQRIWRAVLYSSKYCHCCSCHTLVKILHLSWYVHNDRRKWVVKLHKLIESRRSLSKDHNSSKDFYRIITLYNLKKLYVSPALVIISSTENCQCSPTSFFHLKLVMLVYCLVISLFVSLPISDNIHNYINFQSLKFVAKQ
jgi:hypothetical protein